MTSHDRYVIGRERNVVRVDFRRPPDPPTPKFPGAAALRPAIRFASPLGAYSMTARKGGQLSEALHGQS